jgi:hypothetical protein
LVQAALQCKTPDWCLWNACPACTYKLSSEHQLKFEMLFAMDGNNSLKRIIRWGPPGDGAEEQPGPVIECPDPRSLTSDYYLPQDVVDRCADPNAQEITSSKDNGVSM